MGVKSSQALRNCIEIFLTSILLASCSTAPPQAPASFQHFAEYENSVHFAPVKKKRALAAIPKHSPVVEKRRPLNDPYRIGETAVLGIKFSGVSAGQIIMETK